MTLVSKARNARLKGFFPYWHTKTQTPNNKNASDVGDLERQLVKLCVEGLAGKKRGRPAFVGQLAR